MSVNEAKSTGQNDRDSEDCWSCRLISGAGLGAAGSYVIYHARMQRTTGAALILNGLGYGLCTLGMCRVLQFPPFGHRKKVESANLK